MKILLAQIPEQIPVHRHVFLVKPPNLYDSDEQESKDEGEFRDGTDGASTVKKARTDLGVRSNLSHTSKFTRKYQGAAVYKSKFQLKWQKKWPCITPLKDKPNYFYCTVCAEAVSCGHQGEKDVTRHMESELHEKNISSVKHTAPLKFTSSNLKKKVGTMHPCFST